MGSARSADLADAFVQRATGGSYNGTKPYIRFVKDAQSLCHAVMLEKSENRPCLVGTRVWIPAAC